MYDQSLTPKQELLRLGVLFFIGAAVHSALKEKKDTINYVLYYRGKKVYHGICLKHRLQARIREHQTQGKRFDEYDFNSPRTYSEACRIEEMRVYRDQTKLNVHYR